MQSIKPPWALRFDEFAGSMQESAIIAAPYITRQPVEPLVGKLRSRRASVQVDVLTNLHSDSLIDGSLDIGALAWLCKRIPGTTVRHLRHLHVKAYIADDRAFPKSQHIPLMVSLSNHERVLRQAQDARIDFNRTTLQRPWADEHTAIVTSTNLTNGGLCRNPELGVDITDPDGVRDIADDLREHGNLGVLVPADDLAELEALAHQARLSQATINSAVPISVKAVRNAIRDDMNERLVKLRTAGEKFASDPNGSITSQFAEAVLSVLRTHGPMPTSQLSPLVKNLKPERCDDEVDRVIGDRTFGKRWKHDIRNAQQQLKRDGSIVLDNRKWRLA